MRGNSGTGPLKALDEKSLAAGGQRWRFIPLRDRLDNASTRPSALPTTDFQQNLADVQPDDTTFSHFAASLAANEEINITTTFTDYLQKAKPLCISLPILFRNRKRILALTLDSLHLSTQKGAEASVPIAACLTAFSRDLGPTEFYPFFSQVVLSFAQLFDSFRNRRKPEDPENSKSAEIYVFWDPEVSIVPLFASLADITKSLMRHLASNPSKTIRDLLPLLSSSHYRVRGMTAEACLGFLLRKTRDMKVLKELTRRLVQAAATSEIPEGIVVHAMDGLGVSLFEAVRSPSGRLHSRYTEILTAAMKTLAEECFSETSTTESPSIWETHILPIFSRCYSMLCRHVGNEESARKIAEIFIAELNTAMREKNPSQVGNVAFFFRKWFQQGNGKILLLFSHQYSQKILNALVTAVGQYQESERVVYECLGAICGMLVGSTEAGFLKSCTKAMSAALGSLCSCLESESLFSALAMVLKVQTAHGTKARKGIFCGEYSSLCDQLAKIHSIERKRNAANKAVVSVYALRLAMQFLQANGAVLPANSSLGGFTAPTLTGQVTALLLESPCEDTSNEFFRHDDLTSDMLSYLRYVRFVERDAVFAKLFRTDFLSLQERSLLLHAFTFQYEEELESIPDPIAESAQRTFQNLLEKSDSFKSGCVLKGLGAYARLFPTRTKVVIALGRKGPQLYIEKLSENLSALDQDVRINSIALLISFVACTEGRGVRNCDQGRFDEDPEYKLCTIQDKVANLRSCLTTPNGSVADFLDIVDYVVSRPNSISTVDESLRLLREMERLLKQAKEVHSNLLTVAFYFAIGLLRTPFQPLWGIAGDIWCAATGHLEEKGMSIIVEHLKDAENMLVKEWSEAKEPYHEGDDGADEDLILPNGDEARKGTQKVLPEPLEPQNSGSRTKEPIRKKRQSTGRTPQSKRHKGKIDMRDVRVREKTVASWDPLEWKCIGSMISAPHILSTNESSIAGALSLKSTDNATFLQELLRTLSTQPKYTLKFRKALIASYLHLSPSLFSRRTGDAIAKGYAILLEKMGGLKCCETDKDLEETLRLRLLSDLTRPNSQLQVASIRCLLASRSRYLKPHRDRLIRLADDASFREELTILTDQNFSKSTIQAQSEEQTIERDILTDVVVRICFSKMQGRKAYLHSNRSAVLGFMVSKMPSEVTMPRITSLVLSPIMGHVEEMLQLGHIPESIHEKKEKHPAGNVQRGMLSSIEAILKQCNQCLLSLCWRRLAIGTFLIFRNGCKGYAGQNVRSRCLRVFAQMCRLRPEETAFIVLPVLRMVRSTNFDLSVRTASQGTPAFMSFLSSLFKAGLSNVQLLALREETWAVKWALEFMHERQLQTSSITFSLDVAHRLVSFLDRNSEAKDLKDAIVAIPSECTALLPFLASSLSRLMQTLTGEVLVERTARKSWTPIFERILAITELLVETGPLDKDVLQPFCECLVFHLESSHAWSKSADIALKTLTAIVRQGIRFENHTDLAEGREDLQAFRRPVLRLIPCFGRQDCIQNATFYSRLCELFRSLSLPDFTAILGPLENLNCICGNKLDTPDLDKHISGLNTITSEFKNAIERLETCEDQKSSSVGFSLEPGAGDSLKIECSGDAIIALSYACVSSVKNVDSAVRGTSSYALQSIAKWITMSNSEQARASLQPFYHILLTSVVSCDTIISRREYCRALGELVRGTEAEDYAGLGGSECAIFPLLKALSSARDLESDFFENVVHLQAHRRGRALRQIQDDILSIYDGNAITAPGKDEVRSSFANIFALPLGLRIALETSDNEERSGQRNTKHAESRESAQKDVIVWACSMVGISARWLNWADYKGCIFFLLRKLKSCQDVCQVQTLNKLLVKVVEAFPKLENIGQKLEAPVQDFLMNSLLPKLLKHISAGGLEGDLGDETALIVQNKGDYHRERAAPTVFRAPVAIAVGHLLTRLPESRADTLIPLLLTPLIGALRSRIIATRDSGKKALTEVVLILGSKYFPYILRQVLLGLSEGYRKDACVYVIHSLLIGVEDFVASNSQNGTMASYPIDDAVDIITSSLLEELHEGVAANAKDFEDPNVSSSRRKQASLRATRACECIELLGGHISFTYRSRDIIKPFEIAVVRSSSSKLLSRLEFAMKKLIAGFARNRSLNAEQAFRVVYKLISSDVEKLGAETGEATRMEADTDPELRSTEANGHIVISAGLLLLRNTMNKCSGVLTGTSIESRKLQSMLEPILPLVVQALQTKHEALCLDAVRTAQKLLKFDLSNKASVAERMSETIVDVLSQRAGLVSQTDDLFAACLRSASVLVYEVGSKGFDVASRERIDALVAISCDCLESGDLEARSSALAFLRATVSSKVLIPSVYDAIQRVNKMAIQAQSAVLRSSCTSLSITFMVSFPLGSKRVRQHLEFFVRNLNYGLSDGRNAALEAIRKIIMKFPAEVLKLECEYLFVALTASSAQDSDANCRLLAGQSLQLLFERVHTGRKIIDMLKMAALFAGVSSSMSGVDEKAKWNSPSDSEVQLSGVFALTSACKSGCMTAAQMCAISQVYVFILQAGGSDMEWKTTYATLQGVEAALDLMPTEHCSEKLESKSFLCPLWEKLPSLLLHPQQWIRLSCARLLGKHLSASGGRDSSQSVIGSSQYSVLWNKAGMARSILKSCCLQLEASELSSELGQQCLKNILCIAQVAFKNPSVADIVNGEEEDNDIELNGTVENENRGIRWLLTRMSTLALRFGKTEADILRRGLCLQFLVVTAKQWGFQFVDSHKQLYIAPVMRILEAGKPSVPLQVRNTKSLEVEDGIGFEELETMAKRLQKVLVEGLSPTKYFDIYQDLRNKRQMMKQSKKRQRALEVALDPEGAAKKRRGKARSRKNLGQKGNRRGCVTVTESASRLTEDI